MSLTDRMPAQTNDEEFDVTTSSTPHEPDITESAGDDGPAERGDTPTHDAAAEDAVTQNAPADDTQGGGGQLMAVDDPRSREELFAELSDATTQRDEYLDDLRRARAEFENYRRRMMRDGAAQRDHGKADLASALLDVLDDLDRTRDAAADSADEHLAKGVSLVATKLRTALEGQGLERIDATDVPFDPSLHEAVQHRDGSEPHDEPTVVEVLRAGYRWSDRVLRAAMVVVEG